MKVIFVTVSSPAIKQLIKVGDIIEDKYPSLMELNIYHAGSNMDEIKLASMEEDIKNADLIFVDLMGASPEVCVSCERGLDGVKNNPEIIPYGRSAREHLKLGKFTSDSMAHDKMPSNNMSAGNMISSKMPSGKEIPSKMIPNSMVDMKNYSLIMKYFKLASFDNIMNMILLILKNYSGDITADRLPEIKMPVEVEKVCICDPYTRREYTKLSDYEKAIGKKIGSIKYDARYEDSGIENNRSVVMLLFYGHMYPNDTSRCVRDVANRVEKFADILPIAVSGTYDDNINEMKKIVESTYGKKVDLIINFMSFRLGAGPMGGKAEDGVNFLKKMDSTYIHPFFMSKRTEKDWLESVQGCSPSEVMISVMLPELDGAVETFPIGCMTEANVNEKYGVLSEELKIIDDRLDRLIGKVKMHLGLKRKTNNQKKIAIVGYNYPPGEDNLFGGAFLDTFASIEYILENMENEGYDTKALAKEELMNIFCAGGIVNSGKYDFDEDKYIKYGGINIKKEIEALWNYDSIKSNWGLYPGNIMISENEREFLVPGVEIGNVFVGLQPSRGIHEDDSKVYHDKELPAHYQYIAFYKWLKEEFKADVIMHIGTHGTIEFLQGKECGMSKYCYPDYLLGDCVHSYLYYCGNPSESTIAKRRSHASIVSYQPPTFIQGKLYGDYSKLKALVDEYHYDKAINVNAADATEKNILEKAKELNLPENFDDMEKELYRLDSSLIPKGLHVFGKPFDDFEAKEYVRGLLRYNHGKNKSLRRLVAESEGLDIEVLENEMKYDEVDRINKKTDEIFDSVFNSVNLDRIIGKDDFKYNSVIDKNDEIADTLNYGISMYSKVKSTGEMESLLHVLDDGYNEAKLSGDIYRNPEIMPTGHNLFQFDPRQVPTNTAYERGNKIAENCLNAYIEENGSYPTSTAVICWGIETSRTQGETFAQILSYLGVKLSDESVEWEPKFEIIPIVELGRPRIDVTINICGFFRDMFPNLIDNLSDLFYDIYALDESYEDNYFKMNTDKIYKYLIEEGYEEKEAREYSLSRIFGPKAGSYGSGITKLFETKNWETEEEIGNLFMDNLQFAYNRNMHGALANGLYRENLKSVELVTQIRSSHEYEITDLDHYYEFFGGLSKSVEISSGKKAKMYITDTTSDHMYTESVDKSIARGIRTRVLNPKWIDGMLEHKFHGVQHISDRFENIMGLAATTNSVDTWIYDDMHEKYVEDDDLREKLKENNPYAYMKILEQMMEYSNRNYWDATDEQVDKIKEVYLEIENDIESEN